jgi:methionyl-tRNA formyltransferase
VTRIAFLGTPAAAVPTLEAIAEDVVVVVTRVDKPRGRSKRLESSPVKMAASGLGIEVVQPHRSADIESIVRDAAVDIAVVVAYGRIIPEPALDAVPSGFLNVHFSLLPRWRGAAPVERAILAGDTETGVTVMRLDPGLDTGPTLSSTRVPIDDQTDAATLTARLAQVGAHLLVETLHPYLEGRLQAVPQPEQAATYADRLDKTDSRLVVTDDADLLDRVIRASTTRGGAYGFVDGARLKVWRARPVGGSIPPGRISSEGARVLLGTGRGVLELLEVQPEGGRRMSADSWARGHKTGTLT